MGMKKRLKKKLKKNKQKKLTLQQKITPTVTKTQENDKNIMFITKNKEKQQKISNSKFNQLDYVKVDLKKTIVITIILICVLLGFYFWLK